MIESVVQFIKSGDCSDIATLERIIHTDYKNLSGSLSPGNLTRGMNKSTYLQLVKSGKTGSDKRKVTFLKIEVNGNVAFSKVLLETQWKRMVSLIILVREQTYWYIIGSYPDIILGNSPYHH